MKLVYVTVPAVTELRVALIVADEGDLKSQLAEREEAFRTQPYKVKLEREKSGELTMYELNKDWDVRGERKNK